MNKKLLFIYGLIAGAALFILVYGVKVINPFYDAWILASSDPDIKQHYLGWCHFRTSAWTFPIGLIDSLSYPNPMSCLWTDSIPLFAIVFKLFRDMLPEIFQYLGIYGFLSMALMGGFSALLIRRLTAGRPGERILPFIGVIPFVLSSTLIQRMFYHTSLTAHYFIIAALLIMLDRPERYSLKKLLGIWTALSFCLILIHPYLWAMVVIIEFFSLMDGVIRTKTVGRFTACFILTVAAAFAGLYIEGAFYGNIPASYSAGGYEANLAAFFNPLGYSRFLPDIGLASGTQYEGFAYLGLGMLVLTLAAAVISALELVKNRRKLFAYIEGHTTQLMATVCALCCFAFALLPNISLGPYTLAGIVFPKPIAGFLGVFRSTGRFIWVVVYIVLAGVIYVLSGYLDRRALYPMVILCIVLQLVDLSGVIREKHDRYTAYCEEHVSDFDDPLFAAVSDRYYHFVFTFDNNIRIMDAAYYAYKHGMTLNRFYFARDNAAQTEEVLEEYMKKAASGEPEADFIYMFDENNLPEYSELPLHFYYLHGSRFGVKEPIPGLEELKLK